MKTITLRRGIHWTRTVTWNPNDGMVELRDQSLIVDEFEAAFDDPRLVDIKTKWSRGEITDDQLTEALNAFR